MCLAGSRAYLHTWLTSLLAFVSYVPTYPRAFVFYVSTCLCLLLAYVPTSPCFLRACLRAYVFYIPDYLPLLDYVPLRDKKLGPNWKTKYYVNVM